MTKKALKSVKKACVLLMATTGLLTTSCREDREVANSTDNGQISFSVIDGNSFSSRAGEGISAPTAQRLYEEWLVFGKDSLSLTVTEEEYDAPLFAQAGSMLDETETRAMPIETDSLKSFYATGYMGNQLYFKNDEVEVSNGTGSNGRYWPEDGELDIFAYAYSSPTGATSPKGITFNNSDGYSGSFTYELPAPNTGKDDATRQADLIFAITPEQTKEANAVSGVNLEFHHALSAVVFKLGTMPQTFTMKSITLTNIHSSGTCEFVYKGGNTEDNITNDNEVKLNVTKIHDLEFTWKVDNPKTYVQTFDKTVANDTYISGNETTFLLLPQKLSADAELIISFTINGRPYEIKKKLSELKTKEWEADTRYTYVISGPAEVEVEIDEDFDGGDKKEKVKFQNTGLSTSYMRAAIVGVWVKDGNVVGSWDMDDKNAGTFVGFPGTNWVKGNDGFFYYTEPVEKGKYTTNLFDSYTLTAEPPLLGAYFEMSVVVQAVIADSYEQAWTIPTN